MTVSAADGIRCEQHLYTSVPHGAGVRRSGFGTLAESAGWAEAVRAAGADLAEVQSFLPQGASRHVVGDRAAPQCLAFYVAGAARLAVLKTYVGRDSFGRPGNYLVHAALDPSGRLTARDVFSASARGPLRSAVPPELVGAEVPLPPLTIPVASAPVAPDVPAPAELGIPDVDDLLVALVEALLASARTDARIVLRTHDERRARALLTHALAALPRGCTGMIGVSTFEPDVVDTGPAVVTLVEPFSAVRPPGSAVQLDVDGGRVSFDARGDEEAECARELTAVYVESLSWQDSGAAPLKRLLREDSSISDVLDWWVLRRISYLDPADLTPQQVELLLGSPHAEDWLADPRRRARLLELLGTSDEAFAERAVDALRRAPLPETLLGSFEQQLLDEAARAAVRGRRTRADSLRRVVRRWGCPPSRLASRIAELASADLHAGRLRGDVAGVWESLETAAGELSPETVRDWLQLASVRTLAAQRWSRFSAALLHDMLAGGVRPDARVFRQLLGRFPSHVGLVVDDLLAEGVPARDLLDEMVRLTDSATLSALVGSLLASARLPQGAVLTRVVSEPGLTDGARLGLLRTYWPRLALQAGIPEVTARLLRPLDEVPRSSTVSADDRDGGRFRRKRP